MIANPNGIVCDGCGFLNTSRVTLATGTPLLGADGALNGFSITGGALSIGSNGLDAYNVDRLDLLSRQLSVGGSVWAKDLLASAGAQRIGYDGMLLEVLPGSDGAPPAIGIDVAYLGGMYADRIRLIAQRRQPHRQSPGASCASILYPRPPRRHRHHHSAVGGNFVNASTLQAGRSLGVNASNISRHRHRRRARSILIAANQINNQPRPARCRMRTRPRPMRRCRAS
ncbi:filamentous hemagglutinin N-terminal domain-containing protein [Pantoea ananatis]|nr:filamentous hemagglutinin N-terminal domain-containing protein [Pantoea ananatis]